MQHPLYGEYTPGFRKIANYDYEINEKAQLRNLQKGTTMTITRKGFTLCGKGKKPQRINVAKTILTMFFTSPFPDYEIIHRDSNKKNHTLENLEFRSTEGRSKNKATIQYVPREVECLDKKGNVIYTYSSAKEAVAAHLKDKEANFDGQLIHQAIYRSSQAFDYFWRYTQKREEKQEEHNCEYEFLNKHFLEQYNLETKKFIQGFESFKSAIEHLQATEENRLFLARLLQENNGNGSFLKFFWHKKTIPSKLPEDRKRKHSFDIEHHSKFKIPKDDFKFIYQFDIETTQYLRGFDSYQEASKYLDLPDAVKQLKKAVSKNSTTGIACGFYWCKRNREEVKV